MPYTTRAAGDARLSTTAKAAAAAEPSGTVPALVLHLGGRTATAEARVFGADGTLVAHGTATCLLFPIPSGAAHE